ncbi:hypothetical protein CWC17_13035 [Pseudoalteromonas sp. S3785]|uniref:hypothetical protein n=1 Tax=Pseudoalteromonas sp. S3785 TaxID=579545 RepID=UPI00110B0992|nr:hypothetical protein [Pseudoalteromonas sp. S3785]TMO72744.1 hypothetical protein CWC17_13035 [Pseudoalteromonas sp. S3785]
MVDLLSEWPIRNTSTGQRWTASKADIEYLAEIKGIIGDVISNLRSSLDLIYWEVVSPLVTSDKEQRQIQFPFRDHVDDLHNAINRSHGNKVGDDFKEAILSIKPYKENGNSILHLMHELNNTGKHRFPTPVADYKTMSYETISKMIPDFPPIGSLTVSGCRADVMWSINPSELLFTFLGTLTDAEAKIYERKINWPIDLIFKIDNYKIDSEVLSLLKEMLTQTQKAIKKIIEALKTDY